MGEALFTGTAELSSTDVSTADPLEADEYTFISPDGRVELVFDGTAWSAADPLALLAFLSAESAGAPADQTPPGAVERRDGRLELSESLAAVAVPAGALIASESSAAVCIWTSVAGVPQRVDDLEIVTTSPSGAVLLDDLTLDGQNVLLDPQAHLVDARCP